MGLFDILKGRNVNQRYLQAHRAAVQRAQSLISQLAVNGDVEATKLEKLCSISKKPRIFRDYQDVACQLLDNYDPSVAYFIMTAINERLAGVLPYPPIGQIMLAIEHIGEVRQESIPRGGAQRLANAALILAAAL